MVTEGERTYIVFGYGSLIFKPPPHTVKRTPGFLKGCVRRFAHTSTDHRGTPEAPGRVVTIIHTEDWAKFSGSDSFPEEDVVWGVAWTIDPKYAVEVKAYLDYREKVGGTIVMSSVTAFTLLPGQQGYNEESIDVWDVVDGEERIVVPKATVYVGRPDNPAFIGSEPLDALADRIWRSEGPSGRNKDYLFKLAESVRELAPNSVDAYLFALEETVQALDVSRPSSTTPLTTPPSDT